MAEKREFANTAERKLNEHMELVRREPPKPPERLDRVIRTRVRRHRLMAPIVHGLAAIASGVLQGLAAILGAKKER